MELGDTASAIDHLANTPAMLREAKAALPALVTVATHPAGPDGVRRVLAKALVLYRLDMSEPEWGVWWASYIDLLGDLPEPALEAGMRAHMLTPESEFMPKPGKLRDLALTSVNRATQMADRAKAALRAANQPPEIVTPASREEVERLLADFRSKVVKPPEPPPRPPMHGAIDGTGLTAEMRAKRRQAEERA